MWAPPQHHQGHPGQPQPQQGGPIMTAQYNLFPQNNEPRHNTQAVPQMLQTGPASDLHHGAAAPGGRLPHFQQHQPQHMQQHPHHQQQRFHHQQQNNIEQHFQNNLNLGGVAPSHPPNMPVTSGGSVVMPGSYPGGVNRGQQQAHPNGASHHQPQSNAVNTRPVLLPHPAQHHQPPGGGMFGPSNNVGGGGGVRTQPPSNNPPPLMSIMTLHPDIQQQSNNPNPGLRGVAPPANNGGGNIRLPDFTQPPPTMLRPMPPPPQPQQQSPLQIQQKTHQASNIPPPHHIIVQPRPQQQQPPPRPTVVTQILKRSPQAPAYRGSHSTSGRIQTNSLNNYNSNSSSTNFNKSKKTANNAQQMQGVTKTTTPGSAVASRSEAPTPCVSDPSTLPPSSSEKQNLENCPQAAPPVAFKILKRPSSMPNHLAEDESGDKNETKNEDKSLKQREEEYAQARLRILGSAEPPSANSPEPPQTTEVQQQNNSKQTASANNVNPNVIDSSNSSKNLIRSPRGPDGTKGFALKR